MPTVPISISAAAAQRRRSSERSKDEKAADNGRHLAPPGGRSPPTFAEAMIQLQTAHAREVESLQRELRKMSRKAAPHKAVPRDTGAGYPSEGSDEIAELPGTADNVKRIRTYCPSCGGPSDVAGARVCSSCFGRTSLEWHREAWTGRHSESGMSDGTFDDPYTAQEHRASRDTGIVWNPFEGGKSGLSRFMDGCLKSGGQSRKRRTAYRIVKSLPFAVISYLGIAANSLFIGVSMQLEMNKVQSGTQMEEWLDVVEFGFVVFFTLELLCKLLAEDVYVFFGSDWHWNLLDTVLVIAAVLQGALELSDSSDAPNMTPTRIIRLFRVTRVLRVVRVVQACQSLRVMLNSVFKSLDALIWVLVVLLVFKYIFAMLFMHGTILYFESHLGSGGESLTLEEQYFWDDPQQHVDYMKCSWGSIDRSILTLFESITGGRDWGEVFWSLYKVGALYGLMFVVYVYFMVFLVLNVVIGTVVDVTSGVAARDRDRMVDAEMSSLKDYASDIKTFFKQADADGSGQLSWEEFRTHLENDRVKAYFQTLDLDIRKAHTLFSLLDSNDSGEVGIEEFLDGCLRLRGQAKSLDLNLLIHQVDGLVKDLGLTRKIGTGLRATTYGGEQPG
jgi:hypothetical protein